MDINQLNEQEQRIFHQIKDTLKDIFPERKVSTFSQYILRNLNYGRKSALYPTMEDFFKSPQFTEEQKIVLRQGFEEGLDISILANPQISAERMTQALSHLRDLESLADKKKVISYLQIVDKNMAYHNVISKQYQETIALKKLLPEQSSYLTEERLRLTVEDYATYCSYKESHQFDRLQLSELHEGISCGCNVETVANNQLDSIRMKTAISVLMNDRPYLAAHEKDVAELLFQELRSSHTLVADTLQEVEQTLHSANASESLLHKFYQAVSRITVTFKKSDDTVFQLQKEKEQLQAGAQELFTQIEQLSSPIKKDLIQSSQELIEINNQSIDSMIDRLEKEKESFAKEIIDTSQKFLKAIQNAPELLVKQAEELFNRWNRRALLQYAHTLENISSHYKTRMTQMRIFKQAIQKIDHGLYDNQLRFKNAFRSMKGEPLETPRYQESNWSKRISDMLGSHSFQYEAHSERARYQARAFRSQHNIPLREDIFQKNPLQKTEEQQYIRFGR